MSAGNGVLVAEPRQEAGKTGWYVYWETSNAYGARGGNLTETAARSLATRLLSGEEAL